MTTRQLRPAALGLCLLAATACSDTPVVPDTDEPTPGEPTSGDPVELPVLGHGPVTDRHTAEVWVRGSTAYTTTWGNRGGNRGNTVHVWDVSGPVPTRVESLLVEGATTLGDIQVSDDGELLVVATERLDGSIAIYSLDDPRSPELITRYATDNTYPGVHTAEVARVDGRLHAFLSIDPIDGLDPVPAKLVIVDLSDPANPREVFAREMGRPFVHDVFVRDGLLFTALWDDGLTIWDIGGRGAGSPSDPVEVSNVRTVGGNVHNVWWFHDPGTGSRDYVFVGEEQGGDPSAGDVHVVDVSDLTEPREVAFFTVPGAGTHNFSVDEESGILYAAYYNGGVRALDVRGDLGSCSAGQRSDDGRCDLGLMGREVGRGLVGAQPVSVWGVHQVDSFLYASDMLNGLWKLDISALKR